MIFNSTLDKLEAIPGLLKAAQVPVPRSLTDALKDAKRQPALTLVNDARKRVESAKDDQEWNAAVQELASSFVVENAAKTPEFIAILDSFRVRSLYTAVKAEASGLFGELSDRYNAAVPDFVDAVSRIPDRVNEIRAVDMPPDVPAAIAAARNTAAVLVPCWDAYKALAAITGYLDADSEWYGQYPIVYLLSIPTDGEAAWRAAMELHEMNRNNQYGDLRPLEPHATLSLFGQLSLCAHPDEAALRRGVEAPGLRASN